MVEHDDLVMALGPYLLGSLDPAAEARVRAHLETCGICRLELARLTALPGLLALARRPDADPDLVPAATLRQRLAAAALAERERARRQGRVAAVVAALLLVALPVTAVVASRGAGSVPEPPTVAMRTVAEGLPISGRAAVTDHSWGSEFFVLTEGPPGNDRFRLLAHGRDGRREQAAAWRNDDDGRVHCIGTTSIRREDLARVSVVNESGRELLVLERGGW